MSEAQIVESVQLFFADRASIVAGDLIGILAIQSESALQRARLVWGTDADWSAANVRRILNTTTSPELTE